jgi:hypothetical protein
MQAPWYFFLKLIWLLICAKSKHWQRLVVYRDRPDRAWVLCNAAQFLLHSTFFFSCTMSFVSPPLSTFPRGR